MNGNATNLWMKHKVVLNWIYFYWTEKKKWRKEKDKKKKRKNKRDKKKTSDDDKCNERNVNLIVEQNRISTNIKSQMGLNAENYLIRWNWL